MTSARMVRSFPIVSAILLLALCSLVEPRGEEEWERVIGVIEIGGEQPPPIELPETVRRGEAFTAVVTTWGSGTCTRADGARVEAAVSEAVITPYDLEYRGPWQRGRHYIACTDDLRAYPRHVTLRFDEAGEARIRVVGRPLVGSGVSEHESRITVAP